MDHDPGARLADALAELEALTEENARLRSLLGLDARQDDGHRHRHGWAPLLPNDRCTLLACDFDHGTWALDALAYRDACHRAQVPAALERSQHLPRDRRRGIYDRDERRIGGR